MSPPRPCSKPLVASAGLVALLMLSSCEVTHRVSTFWNCDIPPMWGDKTLACLDMIEQEAAMYGMVSAGAPRVAAYDNEILGESRARLREALGAIRQDLGKAPDPETVVARAMFSAKDFLLSIRAPGAGNASPLSQDTKAGDQGAPPISSKDLFNALTGALKENIGPDRIGMISLRMAGLKFIESEIEDLELLELHPPDDNHRRVVVSLDLTAWVREPAKSVIVYVDLYPLGADRFCHKAGEIVKEFRGKTIDGRKWNELFQKNKGFEQFQQFMDRQPISEIPEELADPVAFCHVWLARNGFLPRLIHVERLGEKEYLIATGVDESRLNLAGDVGFAFSEASARVKTGMFGSEASGERGAKLLPISLGFAAGDQRAGWFFMPRTLQEQPMRPTERRLRMVVDVPNELEAMALHVHKVYLDVKLAPMEEASFLHQMGYLNLVRWTLNDVEESYERIRDLGREDNQQAPMQRDHIRDYPEHTYWELVKSRMRNLLYQGWSQALVVRIPEPSTAQNKWKYAIHTKVVSSDGEAERYVVVRGETVAAIVASRDEVPADHPVYEFKGFMYPGFVDTHNHPDYNFIPRYRLPDAPNYLERYQWLKDPDYNKVVEGARTRLSSPIDALRYAALRALVGGVTTLQGGKRTFERPAFIRNLWGRDIVATPFALDESLSKKDIEQMPIGMLSDQELGSYMRGLKGQTLKRVFLHFAEGTRNNQELGRLRKLDLLREGLVLIHGVALTPPEMAEIARKNVALVWSPRSNLTLYGKTMDMETALKNGIRVALAPDWTVTGSSNMLQELKFAHEYVKTCGRGMLDAKVLFKMVTEDAAVVAGLDHAGRLEPGSWADFVLLRSNKSDPYEALLEAKEEDIVLVGIGGRPVYGDPEVLSWEGWAPDRFDKIYDVVHVGNSIKGVWLSESQDGHLEAVQSRLVSNAKVLAPLIERDGTINITMSNCPSR